MWEVDTEVKNLKVLYHMESEVSEMDSLVAARLLRILHIGDSNVSADSAIYRMRPESVANEVSPIWPQDCMVIEDEVVVGKHWRQ